MTKSVFTAKYARLRQRLIAGRRAAGLTQAALAAKLRRPQSFVSKYERGERRLDVIEFLQVVKTLDMPPGESLVDCDQHGSQTHGQRGASTLLDRWQITAAELTDLVDANPSLRGMMLGYVAELKLGELLESSSHVSEVMKHDDHDRTKKGDRVIAFKGQRFVIESKSLQTSTVKYDGQRRVGKAQVDASDKRTVTLRDGTTLATTLLCVGEFDILAVNLFAFENKWRFVFAKNDDLPRSRSRKYTPAQQTQLLATLVEVTWPPAPPFYADVFPILETLVRERSGR